MVDVLVEHARVEDTLIVFVAGATFNILFAFALACILWFIGQPESSERSRYLLDRGLSGTLHDLDGQWRSSLPMRPG